jgi:hypothetical protein
MLYVKMAKFDHEKLDACALQLQFLTWVTDFQIELSQPSLISTRDFARSTGWGKPFGAAKHGGSEWKALGATTSESIG